MCIDKVGEEGAGLTGEVVSTGVPKHTTQSDDGALDIIRSTWLFHRLKIRRFSNSLAELFLAPPRSCSVSGI